MQRTALETALVAHNLGLYVLPPREDGTKMPISEVGEDGEKHWAKKRGNAAGITEWYANGRSGCGVVTGSVSNHLELFEFDDKDTYLEFKRAAHTIGLHPLVERIEQGYCEQTPGGGIHWFWYCAPAEKSTKLARRPSDSPNEIETLIETKGESGYAVIAPSAGKVHNNGKPYTMLSGSLETITAITPDERSQLWGLAMAFDQMPSREVLREIKEANQELQLFAEAN